MNKNFKTVALTIIIMAFAFCAIAAEVKPVKKASGKKSELTNKVNVNTAPEEELKTLQGVGEKKAQSIIEFRKAGKIKDAADLMKIKGIKEKFVEKNKDRLVY